MQIITDEMYMVDRFHYSTSLPSGVPAVVTVQLPDGLNHIVLVNDLMLDDGTITEEDALRIGRDMISLSTTIGWYPIATVGSPLLHFARVGDDLESLLVNKLGVKPPGFDGFYSPVALFMGAESGFPLTGQTRKMMKAQYKGATKALLKQLKARQVEAALIHLGFNAIVNLLALDDVVALSPNLGKTIEALSEEFGILIEL